MPLQLSIAEISNDFPDARIAGIVVDGLAMGETRPAELDRLIAAWEAECRSRFAGTELSAIPGVAAWRKAYRAFGIKKTSYRSSVERLIKRVLAGEELPRINPFVDLYNAISLKHGLCAGADDLAKIAPPLAFRYSQPNDSFLDMGAAQGDLQDDPPKPGEVVYADVEKVLCRRWNWRQDMRSAISSSTRSAIVTIQAHGAGDLESASAEFTALLARYFGATSRMAIVEMSRPLAEIT